MNKDNVVKIGGIVAIVLGSGALYVSGASESEVTGIVAGVFVLAGVIAAMFRARK